jgi:AraC-like DNA-binding protein
LTRKTSDEAQASGAASGPPAGLTYQRSTVFDEIQAMPGADAVPIALATGYRMERAVGHLGLVLATVQDFSVPVATEGESPPWPTVFMPLRAAPWGHVSGAPLKFGTLYVWGPRFDGALSGPGHTPHALVGLDPRALEDLADALGVDPIIPDEGQHDARADADLGRIVDRLRGVMATARRDSVLAPSKAALELSGREMLEGLVLALAGPATDARLAGGGRYTSYLVVQRSEEFARSRRFTALTPSELCAAADVSERRLRYAFNDIYGLSPLAYLRIRALHSARQQLRTRAGPATTVTRVATDWGFWHLGRFSAQYRNLFGELPSDTLGDAIPTRQLRVG